MKARAGFVTVFDRLGRGIGLLVLLSALSLLLIPANALAAQAPSIDSTFSADVTSDSANLHARINPGEAETTYHFEYVTQAEFNATEFAKAERTLESASIGADNEDHLATAAIEGLAPQTAYEFRAVATNSVQEVTGPAVAFTTEEGGEPTPNPCPNERLREESNLDPATERPYSTELPDCRALEMVSSPNKGLGLLSPVRFAVDGSAFFANLVPAFAGGSTQTLFNPYEFARTHSGWQTTPLAPPVSEYIVTGGPVVNPSADSGEIVMPLHPSGSPQAVSNLYRRDPGGGFTEVGPVRPPSEVPLLPVNDDHAFREAFVQVGASSDLSHLVFLAQGEGWPGALGNPGPYEYVGTGNSEPELLAVKNEGTVASTAAAHEPPYQHINEAAEPLDACGAILGEGYGQAAGTTLGNTHNAVSADGESVFFTANPCAGGPPVSEVYARLRQEETVPISEPPLQRGCTAASGCKEDATEEADFRDAAFQGASADGRVVFFLSPQRLLDSATQDSNPDSPLSGNGENCGQDTEGDSGCNLYAYDLEKPENERLIDLSAGDTSGGGPQVQGVGAISEDGLHAYFVAKGVLTVEPNEYGAHAEAGQDNLYAYDVIAKRLNFIATLTESDDSQWRNKGNQSMQSTHDGHFLLFTSHVDITPDAVGEATQIYRYDSSNGRLIRISAGENGFNHDGNVGAPSLVPRPNFFQNSAPNFDASPAIANNGTVVFESRAALTPRAVEGRYNEYEYERGHVYLLAVAEAGGGVIGIDPSGQDVFLETTSELLPADGDTSRDIYDARAMGGFPAPAQPQICHGDACQSSGESAAEPSAPATRGFSGSEEGPNHPQKRSCPKSKVRRHGRCANKRHHVRHRHVGHGQGGGK